MAIYLPDDSRTLDEFLLIPGLTEENCTPEKVSLRTPLVKHTKDEVAQLHLNLPFSSAIMQSVSGSDTAIRLAQEWGISFIFQSQSITDQARMVSQVKNHKAWFVMSRANLKPDHTLNDVIALKKNTGHSTIAITEDGTPHGRLLWVITGRDWRPDHTPLDAKVASLMTPIGKLVVGQESLTLSQANDTIWDAKLNSLPILGEEGGLKYFVFRKDSESRRENPNQVTDSEKRLLVWAGINTRDYAERVETLLQNGADILCIDSSDGHSAWQAKTIAYIREKYGHDVKVGAGNVVDREGFLYLVRAGADFVKVGIGGGAICITREEKWIGRGQASALIEIVQARNEYFQETGIYVPICSDGGIVHDRHMSMALAMGADFLMMGRYFAQFDESPGRIIKVNGKPMKEYWGEWSERARNWQRYSDGGWNETWLKFEEWVNAFIPYAWPMSKTITTTVAKIRSTMVSCGSLTLPHFTKNAKITAVSESSLQEGGTSNVVIAT